MFADKTGRKLSTREVFNKGSNRAVNILLDLELMFLRLVGHLPFFFLRKFFYLLCGVRIGKDSTIHMWCNFFNPKGISIGRDSIIGDHAFLDGRDSLKIGDHVSIASSVLIYNSEHDIQAPDFRAIYGKVTIEDYVYIGARVTILPGVTIKKGAVIASGAVVTKNVEEMSVVGGIPAREIGKRNINSLSYVLGRARLFQ